MWGGRGGWGEEYPFCDLLEWNVEAFNHFGEVRIYS